MGEQPVRYEEDLATWPPSQIAEVQRAAEDVFILKLRFGDKVGCTQFRLLPGQALAVHDEADR